MALLGININIDDLSATDVHNLEYFGMRRRNKEEESRFKALANLFKAAFSK